jgi:hypothetical protein
MPLEEPSAEGVNAIREDQEQRAPRKAPRVLVGFLVVFLVGLFLSLAAAMVILTLQSRHFNIDRPWFDPALAELKRLVMVLMLACVVFKAAVQLYKR